MRTAKVKRENCQWSALRFLKFFRDRARETARFRVLCFWRHYIAPMGSVLLVFNNLRRGPERGSCLQRLTPQKHMRTLAINGPEFPVLIRAREEIKYCFPCEYARADRVPYGLALGA